MKREIKPKALPCITPVMVSQLTSIHVLAIDERRYLQDLLPHCKGVSHVGRLRLVPLDEALRVLRELAPGSEDADAHPAAPIEDATPELTTADDVLRALGRRRVKAA